MKNNAGMVPGAVGVHVGRPGAAYVLLYGEGPSSGLQGEIYLPKALDQLAGDLGVAGIGGSCCSSSGDSWYITTSRMSPLSVWMACLSS